MSIVTLKRKTDSKYKNNSVGFKQFSINGKTRNQGYVGQDSLSRSLIKTPMVNNIPKGNGGCCGKYRISIVYPSAINYQESSSQQVKPSVLSTKGQIATQYRWIKRPAPFTSVKPDNNLSLNSSSHSRTTNLQRAVINSISNYDDINSTIPIASKQNVKNNSIYSYTNYQHKSLCPAITKNVGPKDQSLYLLQLSAQCTNNNLVPFSYKREPFTGFT